MGRSYQARNARRGIDAEYRAKRELENEGYTVQRAANSHGPYDLIASNERICRHIQVKTAQKDRSWRPELAELEGLRVAPYCRKELWVRIYRKRGWIRKQLVDNTPEEDTDQDDAYQQHQASPASDREGLSEAA